VILPAFVLSAALTASGAAPEEKIVAVHVLGDRPDDAANLSRYLDIKVGEAYDTEAVRRSVRNLFATGRFRDIVVERTPVPGGLELGFRLRLVPRVAGIRVVGAGLSASRVRRITRLTDGETLGRRRLDKAAQDTAVALADAGYLEARVEASAQAVAEGTEAVFSLKPGPLTRVGGLSTEGLGGVLALEARARLAPRPGHAFSRKRAQAAAAALTRWLRTRGYWTAQVEVRETYDPFASRIDLLFDVQLGPQTRLTFVEYLPPRAQQRDIRRLLIESGLRSETLEEAAELLEDHLRSQGHRLAAVSHDIVKAPDSQQVVLTARAGPVWRVASVTVDGASRLDLRGALGTRAGEPLDEERIERDVQTLERLWQQNGYVDASVDVAIPEKAGDVPINFRAKAGPRTVLHSASIVTPEPLAEATPQALGLVQGGPFRAIDMARARNALAAAYRDAGFPYVTVVVDHQFSADRSSADVTFRVDPGLRVEIDRILVAGLTKTREEVVRRELLVREGEPLHWDRVLETQRRLSALGLFRGVTLYDLDPHETQRRSLVVAVEEGPRTTLAYGLGAAGIGSSVTGTTGGDLNPTLRASAEVTRRNLGGWNRDISLFARLSFRGSRFLATYRAPYVFGRRANLSATIFREDEERDQFSFDREGASLEATHTLSAAWSLLARYTVSQTHLSDVDVALSQIDRQFQSGRSSGPSVSLIGDTRDDPLDPRRGGFVSADVQFSHAALGGRSFLKAYIQASSYRSLHPRVVLAVGTRIGGATTFRGQELDPPDRFYAGGHYSMRGFDTDAVLPEGGRALWVGSAEMRVALKGNLWTGAFLDVGGVFPRVSEARLGDLRKSAGVGLRYRTPVGPIRVDWAVKLDPRPGEPRRRLRGLHVTVGHAF
jgi:outer membrane protein insertion porin family